MSGETLDNNSGTGAPPPPEITAMGRCWPAFVYGRRYVKAMNIGTLPAKTDGMNCSEYLFRHGYELAWMNRRFESVEQFGDTMRAWEKRAAAVLLIELVGFVVLVTGAARWYAQHWGHWW